MSNSKTSSGLTYRIDLVGEGQDRNGVDGRRPHLTVRRGGGHAPFVANMRKGLRGPRRMRYPPRTRLKARLVGSAVLTKANLVT
jgi:hypothetical protein